MCRRTDVLFELDAVHANGVGYVFDRLFAEILELLVELVTHLVEDVARDEYLTASEMGLFLAARVTNLTQSRQTPRYGKLRDAAYDRGDFVFVLPGAAGKAMLPAPAAPGGSEQALEITYWTSVKDSDDPAALQAYLEQYPQGVFAKLARLRIQHLGDRAKAKAEAKPVAPAGDNTIHVKWLRVRYSDEIKALAEFLQAYPNSIYTARAYARLDMLRGIQEEARNPAEAEQIRPLSGQWSAFIASCGYTASGLDRQLEFELSIDENGVEGIIRSSSNGFAEGTSIDGNGYVDNKLNLQFDVGDFSIIVEAAYNSSEDRFVGKVGNLAGTLDCEIEITRK